MFSVVMRLPTPYPTQTSAVSAFPKYARRSTLLVAALSALGLAGFGVEAKAQTEPVTVTMDVTNQTWTTASAWSDDQVPHSDADYVVGVGFVVRTPTSGSNTFGGKSLRLSGQLNLGSGNGTTTTINSFTLQSGGVIVNATGSSSQTLAGSSLNVVGTGFIKSTGTTASTGNNRNINVDSLISGGSGATLHFLRQGTFTVTNIANDFAGTWKVGGSATVAGIDGGPGTVSNNSTTISTLSAINGDVSGVNSSLGVNASVVLDHWSRFNVGFDWSTTGSLTLKNNDGATNAVIMKLDHNFSVGSLSVAGSSPLAAGTYDYSDLFAAGFGDYFTDDGGTITVVPEPSTAALVAGGLVAGVILLRRRRRG